VAHHHEVHAERLSVVRLGGAAGAVRLDLHRAVDRLHEQLVQLLPALLVDREDRSAEVPVIALVEDAGLDRLRGVVPDELENGVGDRAARVPRQPLPFAVREERAHDRPVVVLESAPARLRLHELDRAEVVQHPHVVADIRQRLVQLLCEFVGAGDSLVECGE
jgi:hypothetical protein